MRRSIRIFQEKLVQVEMYFCKGLEVVDKTRVYGVKETEDRNKR